MLAMLCKRIRIQGFDGEKFIFFKSKIGIYLSPGLQKYEECSSNRRSLQLSEENIQHLKQ
jgi:hypothetical protein